MRIIEKQHLARVENVEEKKFGFVFNAAMARLLSDALYEDKILAIVRELSTNALDSHIENGNSDQPFDVHLPTWAEENFFIRDYGVGMSPERVDKIYRNYGGTDRNESNDFIGGMGLGSKTPFCYHTRSCTIDSWYDGIHYCYSAFIGEDGIPSIALMSEELSDEPSGVKISLPVKSYEHSDFSVAADKVYSYFKIKPSMVGATCNINSPEYVMEDKSGLWKMRKGTGSMRIIMGNVVYPVKFDDSSLSHENKETLTSPFDVFLPVGAVSVNIGREGLSYDNRTKTKIRACINTIIKEVNDIFSDKIQNSLNLYEARRTFVEVYNAASLKVINGMQVTYNKQKLFDSMNFNVDFGKLNGGLGIDIRTFQKDRWSRQIREGSRRTVYFEKKTVFFVNDLKSGAISRCRSLAANGSIVMLLQFENDTVKQQFLDHIGFDEHYLEKISTIPSSSSQRQRSSPGRSLARVVKFRPCDYNAANQYWENETDIDLQKDGGIYVEFNRYSFRLGNKSHPNSPQHLQVPHDLGNIHKYLKDLGYNFEIYGIKTADLKKVQQRSNWISLYDKMDDIINIELKKYDVNKIIFLTKMFNAINQRKYDDDKIESSTLIKVSKLCQTQNSLTKFANEWERVKKEIKDYQRAAFIAQLGRWMGKSIKEFADKNTFQLDKMLQRVYNEFAVLKLMSDARVLKHSEVLASYVDSVSQGAKQ